MFVASNFVGETGDIAILDDISIAYDSDPKECQQVTEEISSTTTDSPTPLPQTTEMSRLSVQREPKQRMKVGEDCLKAKCTFEDGISPFYFVLCYFSSSPLHVQQPTSQLNFDVQAPHVRTGTPIRANRFAVSRHDSRSSPDNL